MKWQGCIFLGDKIQFLRIQFDYILGKPKKHSSNQVPCAVVGCKSDLGDEKRMITKYEGQKFAVKHGAKYDFLMFYLFLNNAIGVLML